MKTSPFALLQTGQRLTSSSGAYELIDPLGNSAYGPYWSAKLTSKSGKADFLIGFMRCKTSSDADFSKNLEQLKLLDHPHIMPVLGFLRIDEQVVGIIHRYTEGTSLNRIITSGAAKRLTPKQIQGLLKQSSHGLDYLAKQHQVHGSFAPEHLFISKSQGVQLIAPQWHLALGAQLYQPEKSTSHAHSCYNLFDAQSGFFSKLKRPDVAAYLSKQADVYSLAVLAVALLSKSKLSKSTVVSTLISTSEQLSAYQKAVLLLTLTSEQTDTDDFALKKPETTSEFLEQLFRPIDPLQQTEQNETPDADTAEPPSIEDEAENKEQKEQEPQDDITVENKDENKPITAPSTSPSQPTPESPSRVHKRLLILCSFVVAMIGSFALGYWFGQQPAPSLVDNTSTDSALNAAIQTATDSHNAIDGHSVESLPSGSIDATLTTDKGDIAAIVGEDASSVKQAWTFRDPLAAPAPTAEDKPPLEYGPVMIKVPNGTFVMGDQHKLGDDNEMPNKTVSMSHNYAISQTEVTFEQYDAFANATGRERPSDNGWGRGQRPVINVSWFDAQAYARWLSRQTRQSYRLPNEAEWEYAARAGAKTAYSWGPKPKDGYGVCDGCNKAPNDFDGQQTHPVKGFLSNDWGLYDMAGNVNEWVEDCYQNSHSFRSLEGAQATQQAPCAQRVLKGGSWFDIERLVRPATRYRHPAATKNSETGFRIALDF